MSKYNAKCYEDRKNNFLLKLSNRVHGDICISPDSPEYVNMNTHMKFRCLAGLGHDDWDAIPSSIVYAGTGCPLCDESHKLSNEEFIRKVKNKHGDRITPVETYIDAKTNIKFRCNVGLKHKDWEATPSSVLSGRGCPMCAGSRGERILASILETNHIDYDFQVLVYINDIRHLFDFSVKDFYGNNTLIEIDGLQHKKASELWGGTKELKNRKERDRQKDLYAINHDICLIRIPQSCINFESILKVVRESLGYPYAKEPSVDHTPLFMQYSNIADYYLTHSRRETSTKFKVCQSTVTHYFRYMFGCSKSIYLKNHTDIHYSLKNKSERVRLHGVDKAGNVVFFTSVKQATKYVGANTGGNISSCIHGRKKTAYGYRWFYTA